MLDFDEWYELNGDEIWVLYHENLVSDPPWDEYVEEEYEIYVEQEKRRLNTCECGYIHDPYNPDI